MLLSFIFFSEVAQSSVNVIIVVLNVSFITTCIVKSVADSHLYSCTVMCHRIEIRRRRGIIMKLFIQTFVHCLLTTTINKETFLIDFLKRMPQNYKKIIKKSLNFQPRNSVLSAANGLKNVSVVK